MGSVWTAGGYQSDYARNYAREGLVFRDAARHVTGQADDTQVDNARTFATLNIGGSLTTAVSFVVTRKD